MEITYKLKHEGVDAIIAWVRVNHINSMAYTSPGLTNLLVEEMEMAMNDGDEPKITLSRHETSFRTPMSLTADKSWFTPTLHITERADASIRTAYAL